MPIHAKPVPFAAVETRIHLIRGRKVILDRDLAELYGVSTKALNQAVKRNIQRFPDEFVFQVAKEEADALRSQSVTLNEAVPDSRRGHICCETGGFWNRKIRNQSSWAGQLSG